MTDDTGKTGEIRVEVIAMDHFARVLRALSETLEAYESGQLDLASDMKLTATELRRAVQTVFDERKRLDAMSPEQGGAAPIDLDAVRAALQRKLGRLAGGGDAE